LLSGKRLDLEIHTAHAAATRRHATGTGVLLRNFGHSENLKLVVFRYVRNFYHRGVDNVAYDPALFWRMGLAEINSDEGNFVFLDYIIKLCW
jgi:hypothetical protein